MAKVKKEKLSLEESLEQALIKNEDIPYEVPINWIWTKIEFVSNLKSGTTIPATQELPHGKIPYVKVADMNLQENSYIITTSSRFVNNYNRSTVIPMNSVIFPKRGGAILTNKKRLVKEKEILVDLNIMAIIPNKKITVDYVYNWFLTIDLCVLNNGSNVPQINNKDIYPLQFPLPPFAEQQRIVDVIESFFEKLDTSKEEVQNALDSFENRKAAILHKAFTGELTAKWREENGVSLDNWEKKNLKSLCKISSGGTPSRTNKEYYTGEIPWVKTGEINWNYISDSKEKITEWAIKNSSAKVFPIETVLVAMYGQGLTRGRAAILDIEACTNQAVCALIPNSELLNKYLYYYFMCNYWEFRQKAVGGNQPNFSGTIIGGFIINIPTVLEQKEIVGIIDNLLGKEQRAKELCDVIEKIDLMKKAILGRAFRGELGTNDPQEESAVGLLKDILKEKI
ncbi:restriction endonuclease subunit S [Clostridium estertheticum]|uniref:restriction endonuclease subunit S n=1 Tax=Clostridium estertheticum TaxID=238834 RepID=UPI001C0B7655|nr:restriction endonuclease subunit S [Clostridium estertheticum]MBU3072528.1 restriction endonuclease subunit S [Clostridium estertheticum]MBU3162621.1 restriction endonuclease subunit S [Clostridium estertheticum]